MRAGWICIARCSHFKSLLHRRNDSKMAYPCTVPSSMAPQLHIWPAMHSKATYIVSLSKRANMRTNASAE